MDLVAHNHFMSTSWNYIWDISTHVQHKIEGVLIIYIRVPYVYVYLYACWKDDRARTIKDRASKCCVDIDFNIRMFDIENGKYLSA